MIRITNPKLEEPIVEKQIDPAPIENTKNNNELTDAIKQQTKVMAVMAAKIAELMERSLEQNKPATSWAFSVDRDKYGKMTQIIARRGKVTNTSG